MKGLVSVSSIDINTCIDDITSSNYPRTDPDNMFKASKLLVMTSRSASMLRYRCEIPKRDTGAIPLKDTAERYRREIPLRYTDDRYRSEVPARDTDELYRCEILIDTGEKRYK